MSQGKFETMEEAQAAWDRGEIEGDEDYFPGYPQGMVGDKPCSHCGQEGPMVSPDYETDKHTERNPDYVVCCDHCYYEYTGVLYDIHIPDADGLVDSVLVRTGQVHKGRWLNRK